MRTPPQQLRINARNWRVRRRPNSLPFAWRPIASMQGVRGYARFRDWLLVLNACRIPHQTVQMSGLEYIYVPPLLQQTALNELRDFTQENAAPPTPPQARVFPHAFLASLALLPLALWHGWRMGWWEAPHFLPPPGVWGSIGALDTVRVQVFHEWYRVVTALTLHADLPHLCGNMAFGALFLILLARLTGVGRAVWLTLLGGALGNAATVVLRPTPVVSLGFSTALFAAIGLIGGLMACREQGRRKAMLPVAAAAALLAMLGTEGQHTDYAAHLAGLGCGLALGILESWRMRGRWAGWRRKTALFATALTYCAAWWWAFAALPG